jgi:hypothetical protein
VIGQIGTILTDFPSPALLIYVKPGGALGRPAMFSMPKIETAALLMFLKAGRRFGPPGNVLDAVP